MICYLLTGYAFTFGGGDNGFCGTQYFALIGLPEDKMAHCFFPLHFRSHVYIHRERNHARTLHYHRIYYLLHLFGFRFFVHSISENPIPIFNVFFNLGFIYPVASYWALSDNGWLKGLGFEDFAGSGSIHSLAGSASLAAAYMAGPRHDRFEKDGKINDIPLHSIPVSYGVPLVVESLIFNNQFVYLV